MDFIMIILPASKLDINRQDHRKWLINVFVNAIYLYDDKMVITFNYKDGTKTITPDDVKRAIKKDNTGSDFFICVF